MGRRMRSLISVGLGVLLLVAPAWAQGRRPVKGAEGPATSQETAAVAPGILYPPLPTNMSLPTYDYAAPEACAGCHFLLGLDHTSRVLGVLWNDTTQTWQLTGSGWLASRHAQSDHGSTENGFCAKCHSPLQASASAGFKNGVFANAGPVPQQRFQAVTCATCHPPDNITAALGALNPNAVDGGAIAIYLWKGVNNPASYQTLNPAVNADGTSQEDLLCLNCHEQRHNTENSNNFMYIMMYGHGIKCISCHMSSPQKIGGGSTGLPSLSEHFHDWNVGADLPYSCSCHEHIDTPGWTTAVMESVIPIMKEQHEDWWDLPPFNGEVQVAVSAHALPSIAEFKVLEREMSKIEAM